MSHEIFRFKHDYEHVNGLNLGRYRHIQSISFYFNIADHGERLANKRDFSLLLFGYM